MRILLIILIISTMLPSMANAESVESVKNKELAYILANYELLAEAKYPESKGMFVRLLKVQRLGECDGSPESCPQSTVYIAVSSYDEAPDQKVYQTPKGYNWKFDGWVALPDRDGPEDYVRFKLVNKEPSKDQNKTWWKEEHYLFKVNYRDGSWVRQ